MLQASAGRRSPKRSSPSTGRDWCRFMSVAEGVLTPGLPHRHRACTRRRPPLPLSPSSTRRGSSTEYCRSSLLGFGAPGATRAPGTAPGRSRAAQEQRRPRLKVGLLAEMRARGPGRDGQLIRPPKLQRARESRLRRHLPCRRCARMWLSGGCEVCSQAPDHSRARERVEARPWSGRSAASERELGFGFLLESTVANVLVPFQNPNPKFGWDAFHARR